MNRKLGRPLGSKNTTKKRVVVGDMLRLVAKQNPDKLRAACMKVLDKAVAGDLASLAFIADRLDGRVPTAPLDFAGGGVEYTGIERVIVHPDNIGDKELARRLAFVLAKGADLSELAPSTPDNTDVVPTVAASRGIAENFTKPT